MSEWGARLQVARWEFLRFVKPNQLVVSFVIMLIMGGVGYGMARFAKGADAKPRQVAVIDGEKLGIQGAPAVDALSFRPAEMSSLGALRDSLRARSIDGILIVTSVDSARLIVRRNPPWKSALESHLAGLRRQARLSEAGLPPERLASMLAPVSVATEFQSGSDGRGARFAAGIAVGLVLYGVFSSMAYILVSVTAEKQLRVTEQVISAISPQTWIDGKIIGISGVALVNVLIFLLGAAVWILGRSIAQGSRFTMAAVEPAALFWIVLFALLGFMFWLSVFGAVAATIDDPNSSTRGPLMFLPAFFSIAGFTVIANPDSTFARVAGLIPLTSAAVMPARVALTEVPAWELAASALIIAGSAFFARRAAGKIFAVAMLMYGKEPSWREIRRWMGET
jgi:ABC-2 type transport system permease protein